MLIKQNKCSSPISGKGNKYSSNAMYCIIWLLVHYLVYKLKAIINLTYLIRKSMKFMGVSALSHKNMNQLWRNFDFKKDLTTKVKLKLSLIRSCLYFTAQYANKLKKICMRLSLGKDRRYQKAIVNRSYHKSCIDVIHCLILSPIEASLATSLLIP